MERHEVTEDLVRTRARLRDEDKMVIDMVPGYPEMDYVYRLNPAGGPLVGGDCYIVNTMRKAVYRVPATVPKHLSAEKIRKGRMSPL